MEFSKGITNAYDVRFHSTGKQTFQNPLSFLKKIFSTYCLKIVNQGEKRFSVSFIHSYLHFSCKSSKFFLVFRVMRNRNVAGSILKKKTEKKVPA